MQKESGFKWEVMWENLREVEGAETTIMIYKKKTSTLNKSKNKITLYELNNV